jgi:hypothetical protein
MHRMPCSGHIKAKRPIPLTTPVILRPLIFSPLFLILATHAGRDKALVLGDGYGHRLLLICRLGPNLGHRAANWSSSCRPQTTV